MSSDTCTFSPVTVTALKVPLMVCAAVLVMKSVLLAPAVSALKAIVATVVAGPVVSSS